MLYVFFRGYLLLLFFVLFTYLFIYFNIILSTDNEKEENRNKRGYITTKSEKHQNG